MTRRLAVVAAAALAVACSRGGAPARGAPRPVAVVNGEAIPADAVRRELLQVAAGEAAPTPEQRRRAVDDAVERALLLQEARARKLSVGEEEVDRAVAAVRADYPGSSLDDLLAQQKTTPQELRARVRDQLLVQRLLAEPLAAVTVTDPEVRAWYDAHPDEFKQGEQVHGLQIVTRTKEEAEKARAEVLRRPTEFGEVARRTSIAPEARAGGDLGWFGKDAGMPEVFDACFALPRNGISRVVASPYGFHVFKVVERRPAGRRPFEAVAGELGQRLLREKRARAQEDFVANLKARAKIDIDEAALAAVSRETP